MDRLADHLSDLTVLPILIVGLAIVAAVLAMATRSMGGGTTRQRLRQLHELRLEGSPQGRFHPSHSQVRQEEVDGVDDQPPLPLPLQMLSGLASSLPLLGQKDRVKVQILLHSAGITGEDAMGLYIAAKLLCAAAVGILALLLTSYFEFPSSNLFRLAITFGATIVGGVLPEFYLKRLIARRERSILKALPDALDLMVICTESGLSLDPTIDRVSRELRLSSPHLAKELAIVAHELRILPRREAALENLAVRNDSRSIRSLVTTLIQSMKYGTSLAHALRVLANESRRERMLKAEEKAARLPAMMSLPLICFMLPAVFLIIGGPAITQVMDIR